MTPKERALAAAELETASEQAAEAIRTLNHLTLPANGAPGLEFPADAYMVIGDLMVMAQRLPQLLAQLADWLAQEHAEGRVGHDAGDNPGVYVVRVRRALSEAQVTANSLGHELNDAHSACSGLTGTDSSEKEGQR